MAVLWQPVDEGGGHDLVAEDVTPVLEFWFEVTIVESTSQFRLTSWKKYLAPVREMGTYPISSTINSAGWTRTLNWCWSRPAACDSSREVMTLERGSVGKPPVVEAKDRDSNRVSTSVVDGTDAVTLQDLVLEHIDEDTVVYTEGAGVNRGPQVRELSPR